MAGVDDNGLLKVFFEAFFDSWDRNNRILVNLLGALPAGGLDARVMPDSPSVREMFTHIHYVRLVFISEDIPEFEVEVPSREWRKEGSADSIAEELMKSAAAVRDAVQGRIRSGQPMKVHFDHPLLYVQQMIWHEGYHHGQIKLALKLAGQAFQDKDIGPLTWGVWMKRTG